MTTPKFLIGAFLLDELVGKIIEYGTGGDKAKIAARATEAYAIAVGVGDIIDGDPSSGINSITATLASATSALAPYEQLAIQNVLTLASQQLALLQGTAVGGLLSLAGKGIGGAIVAEVEAVAVKEGAVLAPA